LKQYHFPQKLYQKDFEQRARAFLLSDDLFCLQVNM